MERRRVLTLLVQGGSATVALVVGVPTLIYAFAPASQPRPEPRWRNLGRLVDFPVGEIRPATVQPSPAAETADTGAPEVGASAGAALTPGVYVWRVDQDELIVFSRSCTDLGCPVTFDRGSECFLCPCHGGIFDKQGERLAGPPDRPLYRYDVRVAEGILQVDLSSVPPMV